MIRWMYPSFPGGRVSVPLFVLRLVAGAALMWHGWHKIQNPFHWMEVLPGGNDLLNSLPGPPEMRGTWQALAALAEFGGGLAWLLGFLTPVASFGILCTMGAAIGIVHRHDSFTLDKGWPGELAAVYFAIAFLLMLLGPGLLSFDALLFHKKEPAPEHQPKPV